MPVPDLVRPKRVDAKLSLTTVAGATTVFSPLGAVPADTTYRVRSLYVCNVSGQTSIISMLILRSAVAVQTARVSLATNTTTSLVAANDAIYLETGDTLQIQSSTTGAGVFFVVVYEVIT